MVIVAGFHRIDLMVLVLVPIFPLYMYHHPLNCPSLRSLFWHRNQHHFLLPSFPHTWFIFVGFHGTCYALTSASDMKKVQKAWVHALRLVFYFSNSLHGTALDFFGGGEELISQSRTTAIFWASLFQTAETASNVLKYVAVLSFIHLFLVLCSILWVFLTSVLSLLHSHHFLIVCIYKNSHHRLQQPSSKDSNTLPT